MTQCAPLRPAGVSLRNTRHEQNDQAGVLPVQIGGPQSPISNALTFES